MSSKFRYVFVVVLVIIFAVPVGLSASEVYLQNNMRCTGTQTSTSFFGSSYMYSNFDPFVYAESMCSALTQAGQCCYVATRDQYVGNAHEGSLQDESGISATTVTGRIYSGEGLQYRAPTGTTRYTEWYAAGVVEQTPVVTAGLDLNPSTVVRGGDAALSWWSGNATTCTGTNFSTGGALSGSVAVSPDTTTTYSITCTNGGGSASDSETLTVQVSELAASCTLSSPTAALQEEVVWSVSASGGTIPYSYSWSGTDGLSSVADSVQKAYASVGTKSASVTVFSADEGTGGGSSNYEWVYAQFFNGNCFVDDVQSAYAPVCDVHTFCSADTEGEYCNDVTSGELCNVATLGPGYSAFTVYRYQCQQVSDSGGSGSAEWATAQCPLLTVYNPDAVADCDDGVDNDGDSFTDYPADGQCSSAFDVSELAECSDGADNDGNGFSDYPDDPGCDSNSDNGEFTELTGSLIAQPPLVRKNGAAVLSWNIEGSLEDGACSLQGSNGDSWSGLDAAGSRTSSALTTLTTFVLTCTPEAGNPLAASATVRIAPTFEEI